MLPRSTKDQLLAHVHRFSGPWANFLFLGPLARGDYVLLLPVGSEPLVTLSVSAGAITKAVVFPSRTCFHDLQLFCQRSFQLPGLALRCHPALRSHVSWPFAPLHLRHGDSFALHMPDTFHSFRAMPIPSVFDLCSIPHYNMWHLDFSLRKGGWAHVWKDEGHPDLHCTRVWIEDGAIWSPVCRQFRLFREFPTNTKWVPVPFIHDFCCHFVIPSEDGCARVLQHQPFGEESLSCVSIPGTCTGRGAPAGWQLREDLRLREADSGLRDGDVLVPGPVSSAVRSGISLVVVVLFGPRSSAWAWCLWALFHQSSAMLIPPREQQDRPAVPVGKFPWRVPPKLRVFHESVLPDTRAQMLSPFTS